MRRELFYWPQIPQGPCIAAYLASPSRLPFNVNGVFRHYPELDG